MEWRNYFYRHNGFSLEGSYSVESFIRSKKGQFEVGTFLVLGVFFSLHPITYVYNYARLCNPGNALAIPRTTVSDVIKKMIHQ